MLLLPFLAGRAPQCVRLEQGIDAVELQKAWGHWGVHIVHRERTMDLYRSINRIISGLNSPNVLRLPLSRSASASRPPQPLAGDAAGGCPPAAAPLHSTSSASFAAPPQHQASIHSSSFSRSMSTTDAIQPAQITPTPATTDSSSSTTLVSATHNLRPAEVTSSPPQLLAADASAARPPAVDPPHSTASTSSAAAADTETEHQLGFERRWCEYRRRRLVLKDSVHQVLKRFPQWAGNELQLHPADSHILIDLICENKGSAREQLQDDILRQLGARPADVRWRYVSSKPSGQLECSAPPVCSYMPSGLPLAAGADPSCFSTNPLSPVSSTSSSSSSPSSDVDTGQLRTDGDDVSELTAHPFQFESITSIAGCCRSSPCSTQLEPAGRPSGCRASVI